MQVMFECCEGVPQEKYSEIEQEFKVKFKSKIGMTPDAKAFALESLPRSEKKTKRVIDNRMG